jgi:nucleotide-binding universal stress UspA family protein
MFKTIVWATDGSRRAERALPYAKTLAQAERARLIVVHVDEFGVGKGGGYSVYVDESEGRPQSESGLRS